MLLYFEKNLIDNNNSMLGTQKGLTSLPWGLVVGLGSPLYVVGMCLLACVLDRPNFHHPAGKNGFTLGGR